MPTDHRELRKLVQLMNENGLVEIELEREGERIHLRKASAPAPVAALPGGAGLQREARPPSPAAEGPFQSRPISSLHR